MHILFSPLLTSHSISNSKITVKLWHVALLRVLREQAPQADVVYFGDLANAPYGNKSREELGALTVLGIQKLIDEGATEIISACNSVSVSIVLPMFEILKLPHANIIGMVGPTVSSFRGIDANVLVVATRATIESGVYQGGFRMVGVSADGVAIPDLVAQIESGGSKEQMQETIRTVLAPYAKRGYTHVVLGCTHFPLVADCFVDVMHTLSFEATLVDPARPVVASVIERFRVGGAGTTRYILSRPSVVFEMLAQGI